MRRAHEIDGLFSRTCRAGSRRCSASDWAGRSRRMRRVRPVRRLEPIDNHRRAARARRADGDHLVRAVHVEIGDARRDVLEDWLSGRTNSVRLPSGQNSDQRPALDRVAERAMGVALRRLCVPGPANIAVSRRGDETVGQGRRRAPVQAGRSCRSFRGRRQPRPGRAAAGRLPRRARQRSHRPICGFR